MILTVAFGVAGLHWNGEASNPKSLQSTADERMNESVKNLNMSSVNKAFEKQLDLSVFSEFAQKQIMEATHRQAAAHEAMAVKRLEMEQKQLDFESDMRALQKLEQMCKTLHGMREAAEAVNSDRMRDAVKHLEAKIEALTLELVKV